MQAMLSFLGNRRNQNLLLLVMQQLFTRQNRRNNGGNLMTSLALIGLGATLFNVIASLFNGGREHDERLNSTVNFLEPLTTSFSEGEQREIKEAISDIRREAK